MTTITKLTKAAEKHNLIVSSESTNLVARMDEFHTIFSAQFFDGRFIAGYVIDRLGHVESHTTVKGMLAAIERRFAPTH